MIKTLLIIIFLNISLITPVNWVYAFSDQQQIDRLLNLQSRKNNYLLTLIFSVKYPNGCYVPDRTIDLTDYVQRKIYLFHFARAPKGLCTMVLVNRRVAFDFQIPADGVYDIFDSVAKNRLGRLVVNQQTARLINSYDH